MYNLTTFAADHPGGLDALLSSAGEDGTEAYEYANHSASNLKRMNKYLVGAFKDSASTASTSSTHLANGAEKGASSRLRWLALTCKVLATSAAVPFAFTYCRKALDKLYVPQFAGFGTTLEAGYSFWLGAAAATSFSCIGYTYLYRIFRSSLDYENDVFGYPPVIPRLRPRK